MPVWLTVPVPETFPAKVRVPVRSKAMAPLSTTFPTMLPVAPPLPICRVPALMVVPPV